MPKNRLNDFDTVAANNTDISGVGIQGSNKPSNLDDAIRALMAQLADWLASAASINDTADFNNASDSTKKFRFSGANIPAATTRVIDAEAVYDLASDADDIIALLTPQKTNVLSGLTLSNGTDATNDIDIAAGFCSDSTNTYIIELPSSITKRLDAAWAVGTNQGGLDTGSIANTTYHLYVIKRLDTDVVDVIYSASASAPTLPTNYTIYRRIGSIIRASASIYAFSQRGDEFLLDIPRLDYDGNQGTSQSLRALSVPLGIVVGAKIRVRGNNSGAYAVLFSSPAVTDAPPSATTTPLCDIAGNNASDRATLEVRTNTSGEIRTRSSAGSTDLQIATYGWIDTRDA